MENRRDQVFECIRPTNCRGGVTGTISRFWRLYASGPNAWCEFGYPVHRKVSQSGKYRSQVVADRYFETSTSFNDREDCGNPRSRILAFQYGSSFFFMQQFA